MITDQRGLKGLKCDITAALSFICQCSYDLPLASSHNLHYSYVQWQSLPSSLMCAAHSPSKAITEWIKSYQRAAQQHGLIAERGCVIQKVSGKVWGINLLLIHID